MYKQPQKLSNKKMLQITGLIIAILWSILFIINYLNYAQSKPLILAIHNKIEYDDGYVEEYVSIGYTYRIYARISIAREEFVPFWVMRQNPESQPDLPKVEVIPIDEAPSNPKRQDQFRGLLYFYNAKRELAGVYKCVNSNGHCKKAFSGWDKYNTKNKDPLTKIDDKLHTFTTVRDKFAFIDDSVDQSIAYGNDSYQRIIYLYQFTEGEEHILAKYADIKESSYDAEHELASGENNRFIVKNMDNDKWGVISISDAGTITEELAFEYDSIEYDADTKYYILCKKDVWTIYDLEKKKQVSGEITEPIYNVWRNGNMTYYYKTGVDRNAGVPPTVDYKVYRLEDSKPFLSLPHVTQIIEKDTCLIYITSDDSILHFMDYGKVERYHIQLAFSELHHTDLNNPAFVIWRETEKYITFRVYKGRALGNDYETHTVNIVNWEYND